MSRHTQVKVIGNTGSNSTKEALHATEQVRRSCCSATSSAGMFGHQPPLHSRLPPAAIRQHNTHLHLDTCLLTAEGLAAWQLHSPTLWPHLQHLTISDAAHEDRPPTGRCMDKPSSHSNRLLLYCALAAPVQPSVVMAQRLAPCSHAALPRRASRSACTRRCKSTRTM